LTLLLFLLGRNNKTVPLQLRLLLQLPALQPLQLCLLLQPPAL
jgi:hypothetical protein